MSLRIKERCIFQIKDKKDIEQVKRAESVTSVDIHPTEPWVLTSFKSGHVCISDYNSQVKLKSFEISKSPVGAAKFIARKHWFVAAGDETIYCYNYSTRKKVKQLCSPPSYSITYLEVHPTQPYVMSSAYDAIFLWNWNNNWACERIFECGSHIIKHISFNPEDLNTFASASSSGKIMIWDICSSHPCFTLEDENSVNCVDYLTEGGKSFVITGSDDHMSKLWDYHEKRCVQKLEGHTGNVSAVCVILEMQVIITGSKDGTIRIWDVVDYSLENVKDYSLGSVLAIRYMKGLPGVVIGYDKGIVVVDFIQEEPVVSMDSSGKIMWAKHKEYQIIKLLSADTEHEIADGCELDLEVIKQVNCDNNPQSLKHNPDGSCVAVCGDNEYIIYETKQWTKKSSGSAKEVVWSSDGAYAILESTSIIKLFSNNFEEKKTIHPEMSVESIHGGTFLAICSKNCVLFYDWASYVMVHRTGILNVKKLYWAESGNLVAVTTTTSFHVIKYCQDLDSAHRRLLGDQGDAFTSLQKIEQVVRSGIWVDACFIYTICSGELNCWVGGKVTTISHLDQPMYLMGYLANQSRVYLVDKKLNFVSYTIVPSLMKCKELYMDGDREQARKVLPLVPKKHLNSLAHFLDSQVITEDALDISKRHPKQNIAQKIGRGTKILKQLDELVMSSTMNPCGKAGKRGREQKKEKQDREIDDLPAVEDEFTTNSGTLRSCTGIESNLISGCMVAARRGLEWRGIELPGFLDDPPSPLPQPPLNPHTEFATGQPLPEPNEVRQRQPRIDPHPNLAGDQPLPNPNNGRQRQPSIDPHPDLAPDLPLPDLNDVHRCLIVDNWRSLKLYE